MFVALAKRTAIAFALSASILTYSLSANAKSVGKVILAKGKVFAENQQQVMRALKRRSSVLEGDILVTEANSRMQIRFIDGALVSLQQLTRFKVSEYQFTDNNNVSKLELVKGGFRTLTGTITKRANNDYSVKTSVATMAVRGTLWGAALVPRADSVATLRLPNGKIYRIKPDAGVDTALAETNDQASALSGEAGGDNLSNDLFTAAWQGTVDGTTSNGTDFSIGEGAPTNFGQVTPDGNFVPLTEQPDALEESGSLGGNEEESDESDDSNQDGDSGDEGEDSGDESDSDNSQDDNQSDDNNTETSTESEQQALNDTFDSNTPLENETEIEIVPLIDNVNEINADQSTNLTNGNTASQQAVVNALGSGQQIGFVAADTISLDSDLNQFLGGVANVNNASANDVVVGNSFSINNATAAIGPGSSSRTPLSPTSNTTFWNESDNVNLVLGKWDAPASFFGDSSVQPAVPSNIFFIAANPIVGSGSFSGTFNQLNIYQQNSDISSVSISIPLFYHGGNNLLSISNAQFSIQAYGGETYSASGLTNSFNSSNFNFDVSGTTSLSNAFSGRFSGGLTGTTDSASYAGVIGAIDLEKQNGSSGVEVIFGLTDGGKG